MQNKGGIIICVSLIRTPISVTFAVAVKVSVTFAVAVKIYGIVGCNSR